MSAVPASTSPLSLINILVLYCPACEEPFAPSLTDNMPVLLSPCGHSLCRACVDALPPPLACLVCDVGVISQVVNVELAWLAEEVACGGRNAVCGSGGVGDLTPSDGSRHVAPDAANGTRLCEPSNGHAFASGGHGAAGSSSKKRGERDGENDDAAPSPAKRQPGHPAHPDVPSPCHHTQYCMTHKAMVCEACSSGHASGSGSGDPCEVVSSGEAARRLRESAACHARKCAAASAGRYGGAIGRVSAALARVKGEREECVERVNSEIGEILTAVEALRARALERIESLYREQSKSLEATLDRLMVGVGQLEACVAMEGRYGGGGDGGDDVVKAAELESLCAGMSGLCDGYVGVEASPCISVSLHVSNVLEALKGGVSWSDNSVCNYTTVASGPGAGGFDVVASDDASDGNDTSSKGAVNVVTVKVHDEYPRPVEWVTADDVRVKVRVVNDSKDVHTVAQAVQCSVSDIVVDRNVVTFSYTVGATASSSTSNACVSGSGSTTACVVDVEHSEASDSIGSTASSSVVSPGLPSPLNDDAGGGSALVGGPQACVDMVKISISVCGKKLDDCPLFVKRNDIIESEWEACVKLKRLDAVVDCMEAHSLHVGVQRSGIKEMIALMAASSTGYRRGPALAVDRSVVGVVVAALKSHSDTDAELAASGLQLLIDVFQHTPATIETFEGLSCVFKVAEAQIRCAAVQVTACRLFACMDAADSEELDLGSAGQVLGCVFKAMDSLPGDVAVQRYALVNFGAGSAAARTYEGRKLFVKMGGFQRVLAVMAGHPTSVTLQKMGLRIISLYVQSGLWWTVEFDQHVAAHTLFRAVLSAMVGHGSAGMQKRGCAALALLLKHASAIMLWEYCDLMKSLVCRGSGSGGSSTAVSAYAGMSEEHADVACAGASDDQASGGCVGGGSGSSSSSTLPALPLHPVLAEVLAAVLHAMRCHVGYEDVQLAGAEALSELLACKFPAADMAVHMFTAGAVLDLRRAISSHVRSEQLVIMALWVYSQLAAHVVCASAAGAAIGEALADPEAIRVVITVMEIHDTNVVARQNGVYIAYIQLRTMCDSALGSFVSWGGLTAVVAAMEANPDLFLLQRCGLWALHTICKRWPQGIHTARDAGMGSVLLAAKQAFGGKLPARDLAQLDEMLQLIKDAEADAALAAPLPPLPRDNDIVINDDSD